MLLEALSHDSLRVNDRAMRDYQRFEHLGDAVIAFVITNYLFRKYPNYDEGQLSSRRGSLVGQNYQKGIAQRLELDKFVKMSQGVRGFQRFDKFLEALIGAVFMDAGGEERGYPVAKRVIYKLWGLQE